MRYEISSGDTALNLAVYYSSPECARLLLAHHANPLIPDVSGRDPLFWVLWKATDPHSSQSQIQVLDLLLPKQVLERQFPMTHVSRFIVLPAVLPAISKSIEKWHTAWRKPRMEKLITFPRGLRCLVLTYISPFDLLTEARKCYAAGHDWVKKTFGKPV